MDGEQNNDLLEKYDFGDFTEADSAAMCERLVNESGFRREFVLNAWLNLAIFDLGAASHAALGGEAAAGSDAELAAKLLTLTGELFAVPPLGETNQRADLTKHGETPRGQVVSPIADTCQPTILTSRLQRNRLFIAGILATLLIGLFFAIPSRQVPAVSASPLAELTATTDVVWVNKTESYTVGDTLAPNRAVRLSAGSVELLFLEKSRLTLRGPSHLEILGKHQAKLLTGIASIVVPNQGKTFQLSIPGVDVACLGASRSELRLEDNGEMTLQVLEGETEIQQLLSGSIAVAPLRLKANQGIKIDPDGRAVRLDIHPIAPAMTSESSVKTQEFSLVDVANGEGRIAAKNLSQKDFFTGKYCLTQDAKFLNGIFLPTSRFGVLQIDALGRTYDRFPRLDSAKMFNFASGTLVGPLNSPGLKNKLPPGVDPDKPDGAFRAKSLPSSPKSLICLLNYGMTFDLHSVIAQHPGMTLVRFRCAIVKSGMKPLPIGAEAWVFVDGQPRYAHERLLDKDHPMFIDLPLTSKDRFLSIAAAEEDAATATDWVIFADPVIELEKREGGRKQPESGTSK
jgi:hypothetical protein